jgi:hypothetical protein
VRRSLAGDVQRWLALQALNVRCFAFAAEGGAGE